MEENPYKSTTELSEDVAPIRRAFSLLTLFGAVCGAVVGFLLAAMLTWWTAFPIPDICLPVFIVIGTVLGAIWERRVSDGG
jgi:hypothetical protein